MNLYKRLGLSLTLLAICLLFIFHFGITLVHLTPLSPAKLRVMPSVSSYINPFFSQDWHLFAPDPVRDSQVIVVNCRVIQPDGSTVEMGWSDISTPFREATYRNRFSSADYITKLHSAITHAYLTPGSELLHTFVEKRTDEESDYNKLVDYMSEDRTADLDRAVKYLNRIASAHCDRLYAVGQTKEVRVRIVGLAYPRFSERFKADEDGDYSFYDLAWVPYEYVAPIQTRGI